MRTHRWLHWLKLLIGLGLIGWLYLEIDRRESVWQVLMSIRPDYLLLSGLLLVPNLLLAYGKWRYLLSRRFQNITFGEAWGSLLLGYALGVITPGRLGELGRALYFEERDKMAVTGLNLLDKAANQMVFFTLGVIACLVLILRGKLWSLPQALPVLIPGGLLLALLWTMLFNPRRSRWWLYRLTRRWRHLPWLRSLLSAYQGLAPRDTVFIAALSLAWILVIVLQYHLLMQAFTDVSPVASFLAVTAALFVKTLLPLTFGDLGIREGTLVFFYALFQVSPAAVLNASLIIFLINFCLPALAGLYYLWQVRLRREPAAPSTEEMLEIE
ncbi:MAG: UPF0104 family protein [Calditrichaeota bacterium]|nr:MAG: UPF0104 family protein [Calditrichota bacterium]